ncbi:MAG: CRTAC1 family protein [Pirellulales bacterium]|nr:CRTAC1 family protein [Pirellulales bacterium]
MNENPTAELDGPDLDHDTEQRDDAIVGRALRWSLAVILPAVCAGAGILYALSRPAQPPPVKESALAEVEVRRPVPVEIPRVIFTDVTAEAGIHFVHENGADGAKLLPETMGGGCAFLDFDADGDQDLLLVNSRSWPWDLRGTRDRRPTMALYRNNGSGQFDDVTAGSGLDVSLYGMGAAVGDYDRDGRVDVFLSAVGPNCLFRNLGDGKFLDVTEQAGVAGETDAWSTSCGWFDYDNDGDLDLFVCNYVRWSREDDVAQDFQLTGGGRAYGRPQNFGGTFPYLYRNEGDGTFQDVSAEAGIQIRNPNTGVPMAKSLGVTFTDPDGDGWLDVVVANDTVQNFLFHNRRDGTFEEIGSPSGLAFDMDGNARGAMGIDAACFRNNDALGVAIGNFANEMTALYVAYGSGMQFTDEAVATGLGPNTRLVLTFGVCFVDYDLDGRPDLFAANGHLEDEINRVQPSQSYEQAPQLFWNCGAEQATEFLPVGAADSGEELLEPTVGRGASFADLDGDGDQDLLITAIARPPRLLRNDQQLGHHWLRLKLEGTSSNRDAIGAWVEVHASDRIQRQQVMPTRSYLSQAELPVTFGLGRTARVDKVVIRWPGAPTQELTGLAVDRTHLVRQSRE